MDPLLLTLLAHVSAHRRLLINLYTCGFMEEPDPVDSARMLRDTFASSPTQAPERGSNLDPATSDVLAAMTDEAIDEVMGRVILRLEERQRRETRAARTASASRQTNASILRMFDDRSS